MKEELEYSQQVMYNAIAHHLPSDAQPVSEHGSRPAFSPVCIQSMTLYGVEYPFGQFGLAVLAMSPPSFLCPRAYSLAG